MNGAESDDGGLRRSDWVRLAIWFALWALGFWLLQYARFGHHNLYGLLAYLGGVVALCDKRRGNETSAQEPEER